VALEVERRISEQVQEVSAAAIGLVVERKISGRVIG
jgi:hypothetical protein